LAVMPWITGWMLLRPRAGSIRWTSATRSCILNSHVTAPSRCAARRTRRHVGSPGSRIEASSTTSGSCGRNSAETRPDLSRTWHQFRPLNRGPQHARAGSQDPASPGHGPTRQRMTVGQTGARPHDSVSISHRGGGSRASCITSRAGSHCQYVGSPSRRKRMFPRGNVTDVATKAA
jgi:hypothetical protein